MNETSLSLLDRIRRKSDDESWSRLLSIYQPVLKQWLSRYELQASDIDDLIQDILTVVHRELPQFEHNGRRGAFRNWLKTILINRLRAFWRGRKYRPVTGAATDFQQHLQELEDPASGLSAEWDREHDRMLLQRLWTIIEPRFSENSRIAFRRHILEGKSAAEVGEELQISVNAVLIAKSRILKELRREGQGLIDDTPEL